MSTPTLPPLVVIVGPHASGKTALGVALAREYNGEVVSADSRQVYRYMDLGTNKITTDEMQGVAHHLIDIAEPTRRYTVVDFQRDAGVALNDITARKHLPFLVGGTMLYIDAVVDNYLFPATGVASPKLDLYHDMTTDELYEKLKKVDPGALAFIEQGNRRRILHALHVAHSTGKRFSEQRTRGPAQWHTLKLGIWRDRNETNQRIDRWIDTHVSDAMIDEVRTLHDQHKVSWETLDAFGLEYRYISRMLRDTLTRNEMLTQLKTASHQYAKRQMTWWKRDPEITWLDDEKSARAHLDRFLCDTQ